MSAYTDAAAALPGAFGHYALGEASRVPAVDLVGGLGSATYTSAGVAYAQPSLLPGDPAATSVLLDGSFGGLTRAEAAALDLTTAGSLLVWVMPTDVSQDRAIIFKPPFCWGMYLRSHGVFDMEGGFTASTPSYTAVSNNPVLLGGTYDGAHITMTVNGVQMGQVAKTGALSTSSNALEIGSWLNSQRFKGYMQHLTLCNQAVSLQQQRDLYVLGVKTADEVAGLSALVLPFPRQIAPANPDRSRITVFNDSDRPVYLSLGGTAKVGTGPKLRAHDGERTFPWQGSVSAIHGGFLGGKLVTLQEEAA